MSEMRVAQQSISSLVADFSRQIEKAAGTAVGQQAGQILSDVTQSLFDSAKVEGKLSERLPSALDTLGSKLKELGVDATTIGEVLNRLNEMLGKNRAMRRSKTLKKALKGGKLQGAPADKMAALQAAIDSQDEAAELLESREEAQEQAKKGRYGNF
jgi:hypothetical protein